MLTFETKLDKRLRQECVVFKWIVLRVRVVLKELGCAVLGSAVGCAMLCWAVQDCARLSWAVCCAPPDCAVLDCVLCYAVLSCSGVCYAVLNLHCKDARLPWCSHWGLEFLSISRQAGLTIRAPLT